MNATNKDKNTAAKPVEKEAHDPGIGDPGTTDPEIGVTTKAELKEFLLNIRGKMTEGACPSVHALAAMNNIMNLSGIYKLLDKENKELARDVWQRLKQAGFQLEDPPILFGQI